MQVVIYGGAGFIGTSTAEQFRLAGHEVVIADKGGRLARNRASLADFRCLDVGLEPMDYSAFDALVYLSSATLPATSMGSLSHDAEVNIAPAVRVMEQACSQGVKRIIFSSSGGTIYGNSRVSPIDEEQPARPVSAYGVSKLAIERYLDILGATAGIVAVSLRIANPYGAYQFRGTGVGAIAGFMSRLSHAQAIHIWGDGSIVRDYLHVDDVARAFVDACEAPGLKSGQYNVGSGTGISLNDLLAQIFEVAGKKCDVIYEGAREFDVQSIALDVRKIQEELGWRPALDLPAGLRSMWAASKLFA